MATSITDSLQLNAAMSLDNKYLKNGTAPYTSVSDANTTIVSGNRSQGLTLLIEDQEYWYKDGVADTDLVIKKSGAGFLTGTLG